MLRGSESREYVKIPPCLLSLILLFALSAGVPADRAPGGESSSIRPDRLHRGALASTVVTDSDLNEYVQEIGDRIVAAARIVAPNKVNDAFIARVRCEVVNCDTINAFATGGTHVYVSTCLFRQCETEEHLAAGIAHALWRHLLNLDIEATKMKSPIRRRRFPWSSGISSSIAIHAKKRTACRHPRNGNLRAGRL